MSKEITYVGAESYHSHDIVDNGRPIDLNTGESTRVSDEKAAQLEADFPHWFEIDGKPAAEAPKVEPPADDSDELVDEAAELAELKPAELKAVADPLGIKSAFRKKKDVIADILAAREAAKDQAQ